MNLSQLSRLELSSMLPGYIIKSYGFNLSVMNYILGPTLLTNSPWSFFMLLSPYEKSEINSISVQRCFRIIFSHS
jgi:hypothetical protein